MAPNAPRPTDQGSPPPQLAAKARALRQIGAVPVMGTSWILRVGLGTIQNVTRPLSLGPRLPRSFYARNVLTVARESVGKILVHETTDGVVAGRIVEAEAYRGPEDRAAHSWGGRRTPRTEAMFGPAGHAYVFFVYGMHWHMNLVTGRVGQPHAVLLRSVEPIIGAELMAVRRDMSASRVELTNGPGKLCQAFAISRAQYGTDLCEGALYLTDAPVVRVGRSPRIGVDYAGDWAARPWRFFDPKSRYVAKRTPRHRREAS